MSDSESAAIKDPLQYGVARMSVKIGKTTSNTLKDFDGNSVSVNNTNYPLTGIVIEGQKPVDYSFNPVSSSTDNLYIYDADVYNGTSRTSATTLIQVMSLSLFYRQRRQGMFILPLSL